MRATRSVSFPTRGSICWIGPLAGEHLPQSIARSTSAEKSEPHQRLCCTDATLSLRGEAKEISADDIAELSNRSKERSRDLCLGQPSAIASAGPRVTIVPDDAMERVFTRVVCDESDGRFLRTTFRGCYRYKEVNAFKGVCKGWRRLARATLTNRVWQERHVLGPMTVTALVTSCKLRHDGCQILQCLDGDADGLAARVVRRLEQTPSEATVHALYQAVTRCLAPAVILPLLRGCLAAGLSLCSGNMQLPDVSLGHSNSGNNQDAKLALHVAVRCDAPEELVLALLHERPGMASEAHSVDGLCAACLPLQTAAKWAASPGVVRALLAVHPAAASESMPISPLRAAFGLTRRVDPRIRLPPPPPAAERWRPLQLALWNHAPDGSIAALLEAHPQAACFQDQLGMTALHLAAVSDASAATVHALMEANPEAVRTRDHDRLLPADYAVLHGASEEVASLLLGSVPENERIGSEGCAGLLFD
mmetsp:Transcript_50876/g.117135  ORF Transcript_50876/g.117135 Transcript_50876/m.117135 type:complete len:478 (-) Transcript_50876:289-1722(-)|eukprot:CAMPEP_0119375714 /NCGR_PEP_ID=MMETSP1334-20130426/36564_1 /TAXON_ID=127549 /ORGANISM="Calcidiscus leptoporus, Strain RCC1130" /LENGTH=477 /DNA_ID=CAMNT_0007394091 /DNA_START=22 /DNA_END=1455 /DNA_ORIENTATION=+